MDAQQGPKQPKDDLVTHIAKVLREDISIRHNSQDVDLRQPPIDDDHDNWGGYENLEDWLYVARSVIESVDKYRNEADER